MIDLYFIDFIRTQLASLVLPMESTCCPYSTPHPTHSDGEEASGHKNRDPLSERDVVVGDIGRLRDVVVAGRRTLVEAGCRAG